MPELPEVETIKNDLRKEILRKEIINIKVLNEKIIKNNLNDFYKSLKFCSFTNIKRVGKLLIFYINNKRFLLVHLKMTGQLIYTHSNFIIPGGHFTSDFFNLPNKHTRIIIFFKDGSKLFFNDMRLFGYFKIVNKEMLKIIKQNFGIEPLQKNFTLKSFEKIFQNRKIFIKNLLLNQKLIAGLGNIYVDEILFVSGIHPKRSADKITQKERKILFKNVNKIIAKAIKYRGTTFSDYRDGKGNKGGFKKFLNIYGRARKKCLNCGHNIKKIKINGRGTCFCFFCQT